MRLAPSFWGDFGVRFDLYRLQAVVLTFLEVVGFGGFVFVCFHLRSLDGVGGRVAAVSLAAFVSSSLMRSGFAFGERVVLLRRVDRMHANVYRSR